MVCPLGFLLLVVGLVGCASASVGRAGSVEVAQLTDTPQGGLGPAGEDAGEGAGAPADLKMYALFAESVRLRLQSDHYRMVAEGREAADEDMKGLSKKELQGRSDELWNSAVDGFKKVLSVDPKASRAASQLGTGYLDRGKVTEGLRYLELAANLDPGDFGLQYELGALLERFGVPEKAVKYYQAARTARGGSMKDQLLPVVLLKTGALLERAGRLKEAVEVYESFLGMSSTEGDFRGNPALERLMENRGPMYWQVGRLYMQLNENKKAVETFKKGLEKDPKFTGGRLLLAQAYANDQDYEAAEKAARDYIDTDPEDPNGYRFLITLYENQKRLPEAIATTEKLLERKPDLYQTRFLLGQMYERAGSIDKALECYRQIVKEKRRYLPVYLKLGELYQGQGKEAASLWVYSEGVMAGLEDESLFAAASKVISGSKDPKKLVEEMKVQVPEGGRSYAFYSMLALVERGAGELDEAAQSLESAVKLNPGAAQGYLQLALIYVEARHLDLAVETLKRAEGQGIRDFAIYRVLGDLLAERKDLEGAAASLEKALEVTPWDYSTTVRLADVYRNLKKPERAEELLKRGAEANPNDAGRWTVALGVFYVNQPGEQNLRKGIGILEDYLESEPDDARALRAVALAYLRVKDHDRAEAAARKLLSESEDDLGAHLLLAGIYEDSRKLDEAESVLREAMGRFSKEPDAAEELGRFLLSHRRKTNEGILLLERAAAQAPDKADTHVTLAWGYEKLKKYDKALEELKKAKELIPENEHVIYTLATVYQDMGKYEEAEKELREVLKKDPADAQANNGLGYFYAETSRNLDEAAELVKKALQVEPENGAYLDSLGWVYYKQGKYEEALKLLEDAFNREKDGVIAEHVGDVLYRLNRKEEAAKYWKQAQELDPWLDSAGERLKLLEKGKDPLESGKK